MISYGSFLPTNYDFLRSTMIIPVAKAPTLSPTAPTPVPSTGIAPPRGVPIPAPTTTTAIAPAPGGSILTETTQLISGPTAPSTPITSPATGATTGDNTGSTGTSDLSRLLDLFGGSFAAQPITPALAPTSVVDTGTSDAVAASGGGSNHTMIIVVLLLAGAGFWYFKHRKAA